MRVNCSDGWDGMGVVSDIYMCVYNHVHSVGGVEKVVIVINASRGI